MSLKNKKIIENLFKSTVSVVQNEIKVSGDNGKESPPSFCVSVPKKHFSRAVDRNKIRRILQEWLLTNIKKINNHKPYWLLVNLRFGDFYNDKNKLLEEFQNLMFKSQLIK